MHITRYTDYSLRVLVYLAACGDRLVTIQDVADAYDISKNHLMKVVHQLNLKGYIETVRGKNGGMRLRRQPSSINIGALVRDTEPDFNLVECFSANSQCCITPVCGLQSMLKEALQAFLTTLDSYTLADVVRQPQQSQLLRLLQIS
ncbi:Rrf2 family transcriptional regulator [Marinobacter sp. M3C]|jgi:Rrf2 family nitric oxide-sensitive transcriptional repressor|uniref:RrF2 family transcriptional regulator n=1 Tax=unclassified Marinobacter TaxID=83889 RepID=UPI00200FE183|nr:MULTISPECIES: Rrf2 family transcriptional regulator [unclassified Marinobacter]MCL1486071.1 Rrf2 family transcriptional regulator [Marinobacter sp.]UQG55182.1 Rrf2 family transcriptional regulator [Marinobacter sp. M4C]UQG59505.1 Rrf2 family transcriptional regulator [Marinobacter sp. M3C]UQG63984.1 Rrf2 family transcriptional regulator [Marinobacter sp. M2C]UQG68267.1 Rrf2 family transcriptional regulator [Marinobacter sp. M1C]